MEIINVRFINLSMVSSFIVFSDSKSLPGDLPYVQSAVQIRMRRFPNLRSSGRHLIPFYSNVYLKSVMECRGHKVIITAGLHSCILDMLILVDIINILQVIPNPDSLFKSKASIIRDDLKLSVLPLGYKEVYKALEVFIELDFPLVRFCNTSYKLVSLYKVVLLDVYKELFHHYKINTKTQKQIIKLKDKLLLLILQDTNRDYSIFNFTIRGNKIIESQIKLEL